MNLSHTAFDRTPFTYFIGWSELNRGYYGVKYAKNCHPTDLFTTYYTSSKYVADFIAEHGNPDIIEVRRVFSSVDSAREWEHRVLKRLDVIHKTEWLNEHNGTSPSIASALRGAKKSKNTKTWTVDDPRRKNLRRIALEHNIVLRMQTKEAKTKSAESNKERISKLSDEERKILTYAMNTKEVRIRSLETRRLNVENLSDEEKQQRLNEFAKRTKDAHLAGKFDNVYTEERNEKIRQAKLKNNPNFKTLITCPHCGKTGQSAAMKRWHFDNCKY